MFFHFSTRFFFSTEQYAGRAVIIYRSNVHGAFELQGKRLLAQEMSSMRPCFDTGTSVCYFDCTKKFNSGVPRPRRFELCIMYRLCNYTTSALINICSNHSIFTHTSLCPIYNIKAHRLKPSYILTKKKN